ncbi:MAG: hypothetical protein Kow0069_12650 [Promethearchaeota archaeon]
MRERRFKPTTKHKVALLFVVIGGVAGLWLGTLQPVVSAITGLTSGGDDAQVTLEFYDIYLVDYSPHPTMDANRFTVELLLDVRNANSREGLVIPRLEVNLTYLGEPVGRLWTTDDFRLQPFTDNASDSAGLLPVFATFYVGGNDSIFPEFLSAIFLGQLDPLGVQANLDLGSLPLSLQALFGDLAGLLGGAGGTTEIDVASTLTGLLGGDLSGGTKAAIWEDSVFLKNSTDVQDIRALSLVDNQTLFTGGNELLYVGAAEPFTQVGWANASNNNNATGDGVYLWEYWNGENWLPLPGLLDGTNGFVADGTVSFTRPGDWKPVVVVDFLPWNYYYVRCKVLVHDSGVDPNAGSVVAMDVTRSRVGAPPLPPPEPPSPEPEPKPQPEPDVPQLDPAEIPDVPGLMKSNLSFDEYLAASGLDFDLFLENYLLGSAYSGGFLYGLTKAYQTPWIAATSDDSIEMDDVDFARVLLLVFRFLATHNIEPGQFLVSCEFRVNEMFDYIGQNYQNWTITDAGVDSITGAEVYAPAGAAKFEVAAAYSRSLAVLLVGVVAAGGFASLKQRQQAAMMTRRDVANLEVLVRPSEGKVAGVKKPKVAKLEAEVEASAAKKRRWELAGAVVGLGLGYGLYLLKSVAFPQLDSDAVFALVPELFRGIFESINDVTAGNPYAPVTLFFVAFVDFPSCLAWVVPAFFVALARNRQFKNLKTRRVGWSVFWHGAFFLEVTFAVFALGLLGTVIARMFAGWTPFLFDLAAYLGGGALLVLTMFLTPYFWFGLLFASVAGFVGTKVGQRGEGKVLVLFTAELARPEPKVKAEKAKKPKWDAFKADAAASGRPQPTVPATSAAETDAGTASAIASLKAAAKRVCVKCGAVVPPAANFCNKCGGRQFEARLAAAEEAVERPRQTGEKTRPEPDEAKKAESKGEGKKAKPKVKAPKPKKPKKPKAPKVKVPKVKVPKVKVPKAKKQKKKKKDSDGKISFFPKGI